MGIDCFTCYAVTEIKTERWGVGGGGGGGGGGGLGVKPELVHFVHIIKLL